VVFGAVERFEEGRAVFFVGFLGAGGERRGVSG